MSSSSVVRRNLIKTTYNMTKQEMFVVGGLCIADFKKDYCIALVHCLGVGCDNDILLILNIMHVKLNNLTLFPYLQISCIFGTQSLLCYSVVVNRFPFW